MITNKSLKEADVTMDSYSLDPYEQQLLKVFDSHDSDNRGSLDKDGLIKLCGTLQLEDKAGELTKVLLEDQKLTRVCFDEFKDALLNLLGNMQNKDELDMNTSPEREVSPKFVYGSKKYGRRSRPRCEEIVLNKESQESDFNSKTNSVSVQRSNSQSEVTYSKKRKTNIKLKRCTSFPSVNDYPRNDGNFNANISSDVVCTEEMLRQAWKKLGVGEDGYLNQTELVVVCDAIGLNKLADSVIRQLSNKSTLDFHKRISFQDLLEALQQDETWNEFLNTSHVTTEFGDDSLNSSHSYQNFKSLPYLKLGPDGSGNIGTETLIEMWEHVGIAAPKVLLADLGFKGRHVQIQELSLLIEKEIKALNEMRIDHTCNPHVALLYAFLSLHQTEIKCLRNVLEQMQEEREKLRCDVSEANNRASLLAQEVDDNVANMEINTQKHVKHLELRHSDILKEITEQFSFEKEHLTSLNQHLEDKLKSIENDETKLRDELLCSQKYTNSLDKENHELNLKISELEQMKESLVKQIDSLEIEKLKSKDMELEQRDKLLIKMNELQIENTNLRDRHDEMISKIESLHKSKSSNSSLEQNEDLLDNFSCEGINLGSKKRNKAFSNLSEIGADGTCFGKIRRFQTTNFTTAEYGIPLNDSGYDTELDSNHSCQNLKCEEVSKLQNRISYLENYIRINSLDIPSTSETEVLQDECQGKSKQTSVFKKTLVDIKQRIENAKSSGDFEDLKEYLVKLIESQTESNSEKEKVEAETPSDSNLNRIKSLELDNKELKTKVDDLENGMALMKNEYEKCEDYWSSKLDEERKLFEQEQNQGSEKFNDLLDKLAEFEEQYVKEARLPTIMETEHLEKQFTDLEQEFSDYKEEIQMQIEEKEEEIECLKQQLNEMHFNPKERCDACVQIPDESLQEKLLQLTNHVIEATNLYSSDTMPFEMSQSIENCVIEQSATESVSLPPNWSTNSGEDITIPQTWETDLTQKPLFSLPSTSHSNVWENKTMPYRPKRTRHHDKLLMQHRPPKRNNEELKDKQNCDLPPICSSYPDISNDLKNSEPKCWIPVAILHSLQAKKYSLEQRCKKLQYVLKQQHHYDEQLLHYSWQQYRSEKAELQYCVKYYHDKLEQQLRLMSEQQDRLARNDSLVKDLFVDNSYLLAKNQRLEQQYHMLANNINTNSI